MTHPDPVRPPTRLGTRYKNELPPVEHPALWYVHTRADGTVVAAHPEHGDVPFAPVTEPHPPKPLTWWRRMWRWIDGP